MQETKDGNGQIHTDEDERTLSQSVGFIMLDDGTRHEIVIEGLEEWRRGELEDPDGYQDFAERTKEQSFEKS